MTDTKATHIVVKTQTAAGVDPDYAIECLTDGGCGGWIECDEPHKIDGENVYPDDCEPDAPWEGAEEWEFHGVLHTWIADHGWTVPFVGCPVSAGNWEPPYEVEKMPPGRYPVVDEWDDTEVWLHLVTETAGGGK